MFFSTDGETDDWFIKNFVLFYRWRDRWLVY